MSALSSGTKVIPSRNARGNSYDRKRRRDWLVSKYGKTGKRGKVKVFCYHCNRELRGKWEVDRYPICGHMGGRYTRDNIVISCITCNRSRCHICRWK